MRLPISLLALALGSSGCCSIVSHSEWPVSFDSNPPGAQFWIENQEGETVHKGVTPATFTLKSSDGFFDNAEYTVTFSKPGFREETCALKGSLNGWYWGNILFGGLLGMLVVDPGTGAMWKLASTCSAELPSVPAHP